MATPNYSALSASNGSGEAVRATVEAKRNIGSTTITVNATTNWPTGTFIATTGTLLSTGKLDPTTAQVFYGTASGTTITITSFAPGYTDLGNAINDVVVVKPSTEWANLVAQFIQNGVVVGTGGWNATTVTPATVTAKGNRSYSMVFNGTDLTSSLSPGMRIRTTRTVAAPTQCTSLNGSTQFYSKTSPAGMTFTNNFVVSAWVKVSSYTASAIVSRYNGTSGFDITMQSSGQIRIAGYNAGAANLYRVDSYQSLPLNKWVHIACQLDMTGTATTGNTNSYILFDGVEVPSVGTRAGTNPTALVQAGNLEIGSENGGTVPFPGKIAQVAIYSAKVTQATILASMNQTLAGTETSLISAYSFNNSINDLNANANNLTANGSAVATNADSPFGGQAGGSISSTLDYGIVTSASFSTNTTLVVQVPEGCTIPTSGGVSAVSYATVKAPYGMPVQRGKWRIETALKSDQTQATATSATWYNVGSVQLNIPIGEWQYGYLATVAPTDATNGPGMYSTLSSANNTESDTFMTSGVRDNISNQTLRGTSTRERGLSLAAQATYYFNHRSNTGFNTCTLQLLGLTDAPSVVYAELALL